MSNEAGIRRLAAETDAVTDDRLAEWYAVADRGVPWHLRARAPDKSIVSIMFLEVQESQLEPDAYLPHDPAGKAAADFALFTPRVERGDPCEGMTPVQKKG